ncbi:carnitine O-acetyltransferase-like isoform X1 [Rhopilema esculentum]|uniref:carnitine O-acetyltransferase-like isoform X1 n=1 Tax=Rhopilema esculentum TaxID=499914 RepID=UPI0031DD37DB
MSTCEHEMSLPRLPVPPLRQTINKYLLSVQPLLNQREFQATQNAAEKFLQPGGIGKSLQKGLVRRSKQVENWLKEWHDDESYFRPDTPVIFNASPGIAFPKQTFSSNLDYLRYAATAVKAVLEFKSLIDYEGLQTDISRSRPTAMDQYGKILSSCRVPHPRKDYLVTSRGMNSRHIIVMCNEQAFEIDAYRKGEIISVSEILKQLREVVAMKEAEAKPHCIGALTTTCRRLWGQTFNKLQQDPVNRKSLERIIQSVFVLCLDKPNRIVQREISEGEDIVRSVSINQMLHGCGTENNSCNRWFDKVFQLIISEDGHVGCCYEHSAAEAPPVQRLCDYIIKKCAVQNASDLVQAMQAPHQKSAIQLQWRLSDEMKEKIAFAKQSLDRLVADADMQFIRYNGFGKNIPKANKLSPDACIQLGLQLAFFRLHGHIPPTYETASTKWFRLGRTETIRTASIASKAFCESMAVPNLPVHEKRNLFVKAAKDHTKYTLEAMSGQGVDRHLLGLKCLCIEEGYRLPELFLDKGYQYSMYHELATSQVPSQFDCVTCYGPSVPDGYGV